VKILKSLQDGNVALYQKGKYDHCRLKVSNNNFSHHLWDIDFHFHLIIDYLLRHVSIL